MILVRNLRLAADDAFSVLAERLPKLAAKKLGIAPGQIQDCILVKRSIDARRKPQVSWLCSVAVSIPGREAALLRRNQGGDVQEYRPPVYRISKVSDPDSEFLRPVVVGFGPAGMFAALVLSKAGLRPIVVERGQDVHTRRRAVEAFRKGGPLDPENNVQFGEGGAGTFSDGKLNTGTHNERISWVLEQFHLHGADESVLYDAKPHIGTDVLVGVIENIRREILSLGGEILFGAKLTGLDLQDGAVHSVTIRSGNDEHVLPCRKVILAIGHSARDTFEMLHKLGIPMERKAFAMGVRIEHRQERIDLAQYGKPRGFLPPADYRLHVHLPDGTGVFSFCMCPGGQVFAAASEPGGVVTNGMSDSSRNGENANSALLVGVSPESFPGEGVLAGMHWQRELEQAAFRCGGNNYLAPAQTVGDFLNAADPSFSLTAKDGSSSSGAPSPSYRPGIIWTDLFHLLPPQIAVPLASAIPLFGKQLPGFDQPEAVLTGPETRSSSPVRILRGENLSSSVSGLYPCGEGAGYAGGITSAAVDGMRCAEAVIASYAPDAHAKQERSR